MQDQKDSGCRYDPQCGTGRRHEHPYSPGQWGARRCTCGGRTFIISSGLVVEPEVQCARCRKRNYSATAYERGRHDGWKEIARALEALSGQAPPAAF